MARNTTHKPRGARPPRRSPASGLHAALAASLALLDNKNAPASLSHRVVWGQDGTRPAIVKETPRSLELQAVRWCDIVDASEALGEAASALQDWHKTHRVLYGDIGLAVLADYMAKLVPTLRGHIATMEDLNPTLRASVRRLAARQVKEGAA
jgi:hypothetical protein